MCMELVHARGVSPTMALDGPLSLPQALAQPVRAGAGEFEPKLGVVKCRLYFFVPSAGIRFRESPVQITVIESRVRVQVEAHESSPSLRIYHIIRSEAVFGTDWECLPRECSQILIAERGLLVEAAADAALPLQGNGLWPIRR